MDNIDKALEAIAKKQSEMEARMLPPDFVKRLLDEENEKAAKAKAEDAAQAKAEALLREKATRDPSLVVTADEGKAKGRMYSFAQARRDVAKGRTSTAPYWEDDTEERFGEFMQAVAAKDLPALKRIYAKANAPYTATTTAGGYFIPDEFRSELVRTMYQKSLALQLCRIVPMMSDQLYLPSVTAGVTAVWGTINTATGDTKATIGQVSLAANKLVAVSYVPNELMQDSMIGMGGFIADEFTDSFARKIDKEAWGGDASDAADVFEGWGRAATTNRESSGVSGDSANGSLQADHLANTIGFLTDTALPGAVWIMHTTTWARIRSLADSNGDLQVGIDKDWRYNLYGFPVYLNNNMTTKASVAAGDELCLFGNPKNFIIGDRMGIQVNSSPHVAFTADQTVFMAIQRLAMSIGIETELAVTSRATAAGGDGPAA